VNYSVCVKSILLAPLFPGPWSSGPWCDLRSSFFVLHSPFRRARPFRRKDCAWGEWAVETLAWSALYASLNDWEGSWASTVSRWSRHRPKLDGPGALGFRRRRYHNPYPEGI